jgi:hypothetical protein
MVVKTFRGLLADGGQDRIRLSTIKGKVGYRIAKFEIMAQLPGAADQESVLKVYKDSQTTIDGIINFTDSTLLAAGFWRSTAATDRPIVDKVIFDSEIFNQDIFVTHSDVDSAFNCNYYLELEVIPLDDAGAEYTTLKDMRST